MSQIVGETIPIQSEADIVLARQAGRALASSLGFSLTDQTLIATAISELARNIVQYAGQGEVSLSYLRDSGRMGLTVSVKDQGPGIEDLDLAMRDGYSSGGSLGLGLPGTRRLADDFFIESSPGRGTEVRFKKWLP